MRERSRSRDSVPSGGQDEEQSEQGGSFEPSELLEPSELRGVWNPAELPLEPLDHLAAGPQGGPVRGIGNNDPPLRQFRPERNAGAGDTFDYNTIYEPNEVRPTEDRWYNTPGEGFLYRCHNVARRTLFVPGELGLAIPLSRLRNERRTVLTNYRGVRVLIDDDWREAGAVNVGYGEWIGHTVFTYQGFPTPAEQAYNGNDEEEDDNDSQRTRPGDGHASPDEDEDEFTDHQSGGDRFAGGQPESLYRSPNAEAKEKASQYVQAVDQEFSNTAEGWAKVISRGNQLVTAAGSVQGAAESLWEVREECGLMNLKGVDCPTLDDQLHPDHLEYLRTIRKEGMPARYVGPRERVKAKLHPNAKRNLNQVYKQIAKDVGKHRVLVVDSNHPGLAKTVSSPFEAVDKMLPDRSLSEEKRVVHDQRMVNAGSSKWWHPPALQPTHAQIARRIIRAKLQCPGLPVLLSKKDISGAFRLLWVKPADVELFAGDLPWNPVKSFQGER